MTSADDIADQIEKEDIIPYLNKIYDGFVPESVVEQFRVAMMHLPPSLHKYSMLDVETMANKKAGEINNREIGMMLNVIFSIPFATMYSSLEEGVEKTREFEKIKTEYNKNSAAFQRKCDAKRARLLKLSGVGNSSGMNGMKILE